MSDYTSTANAIRAMATQFAAITKAAAFLDQFGSIEQALAEAQTRTTNAETAAAAGEARLQAAKDALVAQEKENAISLQAAQDAAAQVIAKANDAAAAAKLDAETQVKASISKALTLTEAMGVEASQRKTAADAVSAQVEEQNHAIKTEIATRQTELDAINEKLAAAKAAVKAALS